MSTSARRDAPAGMPGGTAAPLAQPFKPEEYDAHFVANGRAYSAEDIRLMWARSGSRAAAWASVRVYALGLLSMEHPPFMASVARILDEMNEAIRSNGNTEAPIVELFVVCQAEMRRQNRLGRPASKNLRENILTPEMRMPDVEGEAEGELEATQA